MADIVIELPPGLPVLSLNGREHWAERNRRAQAIKDAASWEVIRLRAGRRDALRLDRAAITVTYEPPDKRRRDPDNLAPSGKAALDGLVAAGVLPDDNAAHVTAVRYQLGPVRPRGRLIIRVLEIQEQEP